MKYLLMIVLLLVTVSKAHSFEDYIRYDASQIVKFEMSVTPRNVDVYIDLDNDGEADHVFVSPIIASNPAKVAKVCLKNNKDCVMFVEMQEFIQLRTSDPTQQYIYIVTKNYILDYSVDGNKGEEYNRVINSTHGFITNEYELKNKPKLRSWFEEQMKK